MTTTLEDIDREVRARVESYKLTRWMAFALGGLVTSGAMLVIFIYTTKVTPVCDDGHVGFRIEQCLAPS